MGQIPNKAQPFFLVAAQSRRAPEGSSRLAVALARPVASLGRGLADWDRERLFSPHSATPPPPTDLQEGHYAITRDGLQQAGGPCEALQPSPTGGEEGSDDDNPGGGPGQCAHHQVATHSFTEPGMKQRQDRRYWVSDATWISRAGLPHQLQNQLCAHSRAGLSRGKGRDKAPNVLGSFCLHDLGYVTSPLLAPLSSPCKTRIITNPSHTTGERIGDNACKMLSTVPGTWQ